MRRLKSTHEFRIAFNVESEGEEPTPQELLQGALDKIRQLHADHSEIPVYVEHLRSFDCYKNSQGITFTVERDPLYDDNASRPGEELPF